MVTIWTQEEVNKMSDEELRKAWLQQENEREKDENEDDDRKSELEILTRQSEKIAQRLDELEKIVRQK